MNTQEKMSRAEVKEAIEFLNRSEIQKRDLEGFLKVVEFITPSPLSFNIVWRNIYDTIAEDGADLDIKIDSTNSRALSYSICRHVLASATNLSEKLVNSPEVWSDEQ